MQRTDHLGRLSGTGHCGHKLFLHLGQTLRQGRLRVLQLFHLVDLFHAALGGLRHKRCVILV